MNIESLRQEWPIDDAHKATERTSHCDVCFVRMPCDWSLVIADLHAALDEIERLT